jgi:hypothetical protein
LHLSITRAYAETLGLRALAFLAGTPEALDRFLTLSGTDGGDLRARAAEPETLAALLEFLLTDEALLTQFCDDEGIEPKAVHLAAARLGM